MKEYIIAFECPATESSERIAYQVQQKFVSELIRCKDCKHWKLLENSDTIGTCWLIARYPLADSFCDKAERKEE